MVYPLGDPRSMSLDAVSLDASYKEHNIYGLRGGEGGGNNIYGLGAKNIYGLVMGI